VFIKDRSSLESLASLANSLKTSIKASLAAISTISYEATAVMRSITHNSQKLNVVKMFGKREATGKKKVFFVSS
jgi:hypothetical protein